MNEGPPQNSAESTETINPYLDLPYEILEEEIEQELIPKVNELFDIAEQIDEKIKASNDELSPELQNQIKEYSESANRFFRRMLLTIGFVTAATTAITSRNHPESDAGQTIHNIELEVAEKPDSIIENQTDSGKEFNHTDSITTHTLNYFAGRDTLSEKEVEQIFKNTWRENLESDGDSIPSDWDQMSTEECVVFMANRGNRTPEWKLAWKEIYMKNYNKFPRYFSAKSGIYEALWQIEKETGSPKVRIMESDKKLKEEWGRSGYYQPETNMVVISAVELMIEYRPGQNIVSNPKLIRPLFSEFSHAEQQKGNPKETDRRFSEDLKQRYDRAKTLGITEDAAQKYEYSTPGTIEHEAHKIIEPRLKQQFKILVKEFGKQKTRTYPPKSNQN